MSDIDEEEVRDPDADLPRYKLRYTDMNIEQLKLIVRSNQFIIQRPISY